MASFWNLKNTCLYFACLQRAKMQMNNVARQLAAPKSVNRELTRIRANKN